MNLDIIIPAFNAIDSIKNTLNSIASQRDAIGFNVYIVNDCSDYDYQDIVNEYKEFFNISEIIAKTNGGPGLARNIGINNSKSKYIMFIDSDDYLYDENSLKTLYDAINEDDSLDLVISNFLYQRDGESIIKKNNPVWLHGKIYKRSFLDKYSIRFNNTRSNEDNGFNRLIFFMDPKYKVLDSLTYVYSENPNSITRKDNRLFKFNGLEGLSYNMAWAINEAIKRSANEFDIAIISLNTLVAMYVYYNELNKDYDGSKIVAWTKDIYNIYKHYVYLLPKNAVDISIDAKKKEYENEGKKLILYISFDEFVRLLENIM